MKKHYDTEKILEGLPNESEERKVLTTKIKKYRNECGCAMGGRFLVASIIVTIIYFAILGDGGRSLPREVLISLIFVFFFSLIGKLVGIGIARWKLAALLRSTYKKLYVS